MVSTLSLECLEQAFSPVSQDMRAWENSEQHRQCVHESLSVWRLCPVIPKFSAWCGADRLCYGTGAHESVGCGLWLWAVDTSLPLLHGDWPVHVGSANLATSGLGPRLSGQMNLNDGKGLFFASVLIADTPTGQKYRPLGSYGRVWVDSHLILAYVPCLLPSAHCTSLYSMVSGASWERWCSWPETATSLKAPHLSSLTSQRHCSVTASLQ